MNYDSEEKCNKKRHEKLTTDVCLFQEKKICKFHTNSTCSYWIMK